MPYLIDGHNLIPKLGLSLRALDDELELIAVLQEFCRLNRRRTEVYFDGAPPGQDGSRKLGSVDAHFVRQGMTADEAIRRRLKKLGRAARNWTVVSSDHQVQAEAQAVHALVLSSEEFARQLKQNPGGRSDDFKADRELRPEEVDEWLKVFKGGDRDPGHD
jgi:hypothetical protein